MMIAKNKASAESMNIIKIFGSVFAAIFLLNVLLANVIFSLPFMLHLAFMAGAIFGFYVHFSLICLNDDYDDPYNIEGRGKLLIPIVWVCVMIVRLMPRVRHQEWHKHRGLIITGITGLIICLAISLLLGMPLSWPVLIVSAITVSAGYYSVSFLPLAWVKLNY